MFFVVCLCLPDRIPPNIILVLIDVMFCLVKVILGSGGRIVVNGCVLSGRVIIVARTRVTGSPRQCSGRSLSVGSYVLFPEATADYRQEKGLVVGYSNEA